MSFFDLLFLLVVAAGLAAVIRVLVAALRGRGTQAGRILRRAAVGAAVYLAIVLLVGALSPQRVLAVGDDQCFDDLCFTVDDVATTPRLGPDDGAVEAQGVFYVVGLHLSNRGRGRPQRASSVAVYLLDGHGRRLDVAAEGQRAYEAEHGATAPLTSTVDVGHPVETLRVFDVPADAGEVGLVVRHPDGPSPGLFVIGDGFSLLHKPTMVRLVARGAAEEPSAVPAE